MATSTISYFSRRGTTPGKSKKKSLKHSTTGQLAAQSYQMTPLFFQETMEANQSTLYRIDTNPEDETELTFDQPSASVDMSAEVTAGGDLDTGRQS